MRPPIPRWLGAALTSAALVAAVTAVIALLEPDVPALGLGVLYLLAVVPIALLYGGAVAAAASVASMVAFDFFVLAPRHSLDPGTSNQWGVLLAFLVSSLVVGQLAARSQRDARRSARLADEQAALRRVATLVARGVPPPEVFAAVAREVGLLLGVDATHLGRYELDGTATGVAAWSSTGDHIPVGTRVDLDGESVAALVSRTGQPARMHGYEHASGPGAALGRDLGLRSSVGAPIVVDQRLWGVMIASSKGDGWLPADAESRIAAFTEQVATAIANAESRADLARLAEEQAALRRVATLVARGTRPEEVFAAVVEEVGRLTSADMASMCRYESDGTITWVASWGKALEAFPVGSRRVLGGTNLATIVFETGRSARIDDYAESASGTIGVGAREAGINTSLGTPIMVEGRLWGVIAAGSTGKRQLPVGIETRLAEFTELAATAISNAESRAALGRLADEQAALRRVATLVAQGAPPAELFSAVSEEVGHLFGADQSTVGRFEPDGPAVVLVGTRPDIEGMPVGTRLELDDALATTAVFRTGRAARADDSVWRTASGPTPEMLRRLGFRSTVASPIIVEGRRWGAMTVSTKREPLPPDTEERLANFTELVATAIANSESRAALGRLAEQQAALRRVATLVAKGVPPAEVFSALGEEVNKLLHAQTSSIARLEADGTVMIVAHCGTSTDALALGTRVEPEPGWVLTAVIQTGRSARKDDYDDYDIATESMPGVIRRMGIRSSVAAPIVVEGALWGVIIVGTATKRFPDGTERRLEEFTELAAMAIANAESRAEVTASRARIVAASDEGRRRIERDLHDGAQQLLVSLALTLRGTASAIPNDLGEVRAELAQVGSGLERVLEDLREISRGIHPAILSEGGLAPALRTLARRSTVPVVLDLAVDERLPAPIEVAAYYVVAEALTNAAKHATASAVRVDVDASKGALRLAISDDGVGGADPGKGSGLIGLHDRVEALGGAIDVSSAVGEGTLIVVELPLQPGATMPTTRPSSRPA